MVKKKCGDGKVNINESDLGVAWFCSYFDGKVKPTHLNEHFRMDGLIGGQFNTKLSGEAYWATWKFKLTVLLRATNLLGITDGTTPPPVKEESKQDYEKWAEKDTKAQNIIVTSIEDCVLQQIISCKTACDIWNKLHTVYEQKK
ncbi:hypothetical protein PR048_007776 [Dryococelus australis]|uniref:Uncharacterized protein n=1 Tax=Dryococelus australis TaxID=614101 RepID=A0ABQ9HV78_9NEOP|nr:hypothetical protein PR048_007776 [Dryococelus australis]